jgi:hypothetical protein
VLEFDVQNAWVSSFTSSYVDFLSVHYGPSGGPYDLECSVLEATGDPVTTITCVTSEGEDGPYHFVITALNYDSEEGPDTFTYPDIPVVTNVTGCTDERFTGATVDCPTSGGITLTITGAASTQAQT